MAVKIKFLPFLTLKINVFKKFKLILFLKFKFFLISKEIPSKSQICHSATASKQLHFNVNIKRTQEIMKILSFSVHRSIFLNREVPCLRARGRLADKQQVEEMEKQFVSYRNNYIRKVPGS